jgi:hypothetical protein
MLRHFESSEEQSREMANALATEIFSRAEGDRMERLEELIRGKSATSLNT